MMNMKRCAGRDESLSSFDENSLTYHQFVPKPFSSRASLSKNEQMMNATMNDPSTAGNIESIRRNLEKKQVSTCSYFTRKKSVK
jgi:hypothetical protein